MPGISIVSLLTLAGHTPLFQAAAIVLATFILEDAATVAAAMDVQQGGVSWDLALAALILGIVLGDIGLYGLGWVTTRLPWIGRLLPPPRKDTIRAWLDGRIFRVVLASRFLPGLRLPTYTTCGYVGANLTQFAGAAVIATCIWTTLLFIVSLHVGSFLMAHFGAWRWAGAAGFVVFVILAGRFAAARLQSCFR